jgi:hypothetical protein
MQSLLETFRISNSTSVISFTSEVCGKSDEISAIVLETIELLDQLLGILPYCKGLDDVMDILSFLSECLIGEPALFNAFLGEVGIELPFFWFFGTPLTP